MVLVIAGNYQQYLAWRRQGNNALEESRYVCRPEDLIGCRNVTIVRTGEWWLNPVAEDDYLSLLDNPTEKPNTFETEKGTS